MLNIFGFIVTKSNSLSADEKPRDSDARRECAPSPARDCPHFRSQLESGGWAGQAGRGAGHAGRGRGRQAGRGQDQTSPPLLRLLEWNDFDLSLMHGNFLFWLDIHQQRVARLQEWEKVCHVQPFDSRANMRSGGRR